VSLVPKFYIRTVRTRDIKLDSVAILLRQRLPNIMDIHEIDIMWNKSNPTNLYWRTLLFLSFCVTPLWQFIIDIIRKFISLTLDIIESNISLYSLLIVPWSYKIIITLLKHPDWHLILANLDPIIIQIMRLRNLIF